MTHYNIDTSTPVGEMIVVVLMALAEMQSKQMSVKQTTSQEVRADKGYRHGPSPPFGYDLGDSPGTLKVNELKVSIVRAIFSEYLDQGSFAVVAKAINERGYRTRKDKKFDSYKIRYILENRAYIADREVNKKYKGMTDDEVPPGKTYYIVHSEMWEPIMNLPTFERVQRLIHKRRMTKSRVLYTGEALLPSLRRCTMPSLSAGDGSR